MIKSGIQRVVLSIFAVLCAADFAVANPLNDELVYIVTNHPNIKAGSKTIESRHEQIRQSQAGYYPSVDLNATAGPEYINSPGERSENGKPSSRTKQTATLTMTQNLFNGFSTASNVKVSRLNKALAGITQEGTIQNTIFEGISNYVDVLRQRHLLGLSRTSVINIEHQLNLEDERVQRGSGIAVDVLQAKSRLQIAKERQVSFEGALEDAVSRYAQVFNHAPNISSMTDPVPPVEVIPSAIDRAMDIALQENPAVGNSVVTMEVARTQKAIRRAEYFPTFDMVSTMNIEKNNGAVLGTRRDYSFVLQANMNLFNGFSTEAGVSQTNFDYRATKDNHLFVTRQIIQQTRLAWQALVTSRQRVQLLENAVNIAAEVFTARKKLREAGKETVINVLDAENEVINAQINYTSATFDERIAIYQLMLAMGRLNATYLNLEL
ncbi:MAG: TolC family outer membrane protein [Rhodospirillales bacterium]|nr:TolC family outer membrane protein [Rhodospirillaceae bacterium]MBT6361099.1 TolC family outer membrane protein [Rhodospirillaceae bacterium]MBT8004161.1 TolC family outer membrane protein [Rhodospirillales bacterium]